MMKKTMYLTGLLTMSTVLIASAQSLYTTTNDFAQFNPNTTSSLYYSDSSTVNGVGNTSNPGGTGGIGSLQLTLAGGWGGIADAPGQAGNQGFLTAIDPGATAGASTVAGSGTLTFDVYTANITSWYQFGVLFNYDNNWTPFFSSSTSSFTGADGNTWTHVVVPYTINATSLSYFGFSIMENADSVVAGETVYVDNFQVAAAPEPGTMALAAIGGASLLFWRRRAVR
jgi:hypothetical protein